MKNKKWLAVFLCCPLLSYAAEENESVSVNGATSQERCIYVGSERCVNMACMNSSDRNCLSKCQKMAIEKCR
jgi:hypothetical protein